MPTHASAPAEQETCADAVAPERKAGMDDITRELRESAALKMHVAETQGHILRAMVECMWESLQQGGKLLWCGNGGSAADAQHLVTE